jgi:hypothetical protein
MEMNARVFLDFSIAIRVFSFPWSNLFFANLTYVSNLRILHTGI